VVDIRLDFIGTDPRQATDFMNRKASSGDLGKGVVSASVGLDLVTRGIADRFFRLQKISAEDQIVWAGGRDPADPRIRAELIYKARPLNGIWAVAPYLHNGSVPTLRDLLKPAADRPKVFFRGYDLYDPIDVGFVSQGPEAQRTGTRLDVTSKSGGNQGHEFGTDLLAKDKDALLEYLKTL